ncbi:MAG: NUDIX domain-containing protein [Methanobacteriota archaeon]|nr:MAG: NUDIX domain-containing protein [Euryarchaeota archaeon]
MRRTAVDGVIIRGGNLVVAKRLIPPYKGTLTFPGGHIEEQESAEDALYREIKEETGLDAKIIRGIGVYSQPSRDPRHIISYAFLCFADGELESSNEGAVRWEEIHSLLKRKFGFDHGQLLIDAVNALVHLYIDEMLYRAITERAPVITTSKGEEPFHKLLFIALSARTKDNKTGEALEKLIAKFPTPSKLARASPKEVESLLYGVGFHRQKARNIIELAKIIAKEGMPTTYDELVELPGVGPKTAKVFLAEVIGEPTIGVDTHVHRVSNRLSLVSTKTPAETAKALSFLDDSNKRRLNLAFVGYGQTICKPRNPLCSSCKLSRYCHYSYKNKTGYWKSG